MVIGKYSKVRFPIINKKILWHKGKYYLAKDPTTIYLLKKMKITKPNCKWDYYYIVINSLKINENDIDAENIFVNEFNKITRLKYCIVVSVFNSAIYKRGLIK